MPVWVATGRPLKSKCVTRYDKRHTLGSKEEGVAPLNGLNESNRGARYRQALEFAEQQVARLIERSPDFFPIYTAGGRWRHEGELWTDWTGGFLAGMMWQFHRRTGSPRWQQRAEHYSRLLEPRQFDRKVHDLGFIFLNTYLPWYEQTEQPRLVDVLVQAGRTLALRFQEKGDYLCSFVAPESLFIDIMMNVPLIAYAAERSGDDHLREIAISHSRTTARYLVRADGSTAHEGVFDGTSGEFLHEDTHQGLRPQSAWARGLAWSLYGFGTMYRLTGLDEFLDIAERNAEYWLANLPADRVPYWDFDADLGAPLPLGPQKDSSAGAIAAGGLLQLAWLTKSAALAGAYRSEALAMLDALVEPGYLALDTPGWEGILKHGVYHTRKNLGVDESVMWGEFFFVEALTRVLAHGEAKA